MKGDMRLTKRKTNWLVMPGSMIGLILLGLGWLVLVEHIPLDRFPWSLGSALVILALTGLCVAAVRAWTRPRLALVLSAGLVVLVLWALPSIVSPCGPLVAAVSAGSAQCQQCCTWWVPYPCSLCSSAEYAAGECIGCCLRYEECNCVTPEPNPVIPTRTPTTTPTRTPSLTPTHTRTPTFTPTSTRTPSPTPTPLPPLITGTLSCDRWGLDGWCMENARLILSATDPQGFAVTISGQAGNLPIACSASCLVDLPEGQGTATFTATSASGRTASGNFAWKYDASAPDAGLQLDGSAGASDWYISDVNVNGVGADAVSGVEIVEVSMDGGAWLPDVTLSDGAHQVQARVVDEAGWETLSGIQTVRVDTIHPDLSVLFSGIEGGGGYYRSAVTVSLMGTDAGSGVEWMEVRLDGREWVKADGITIATDGIHIIAGRVTDRAGNITEKSISVQIDTTSPLAIFATPAPGSTNAGQGVVELSGKVSDAESGIACMELSLDGGRTWQSLPLVNDTWRYDWDTTALPNGEYAVIARALDLAGNVQSPGSLVTILAANHPPFVDVQEHWNIWESGSLSVRENGGVPVDSLRITIRDPQGRWPEVVQEYAIRKVPDDFTWNRKFADGTLAPSGEYEVIVEASDIYGNEASDRGVIVIPFATPVTITPTSTSIPPTPGSTLVQTAMPTPAAIVPALPTVQPTSAPVAGPGRKSLVLWPAVGLMGLLIALGSSSIADARPRALNKLKETFHQIMQNQGDQ